MHRDPMDPEECLRSLTAAALLRARPDRSRFPVSLGLQATANALVMLGLLPESRAETILAEHRLALERAGVENAWGVTRGELTVRPGAHGYWQARTAGPRSLSEWPLSVTAAGVSCTAPAADVCFEWVTLTPAGLRASFRATAPDPRDHPGHGRAAMQRAMSQISLTDDTGRAYDLIVGDLSWSSSQDRRELPWQGQVIAEPKPATRPGWLEFAPAADGACGRVVLSSPAQVPTGTAQPPWPTAAECYLAALAPVTSMSIASSGEVAEAGPADTAEIVATVADSLLAVGALPVTSSLLRGFPAGGPGWPGPLAQRWGRRAHQRGGGFQAAEHRGLAVRLPLERATVVLESVSARGELVSLRLHGHPWVSGEYWPMITPCLAVRATDDAGDEHDGMPGDWSGGPGHEGSGSFWFWPPVDRARQRLTVTVSTLWEAAWADVELPR